MTQWGKCRNFLAEDTWPRGALPCLVLVSICQILRKASPARKICQQQRSFVVVATIPISRARYAASRHFETVAARASCTTWAIWFLVDPVTSSSFTRNTAARGATNSSMPTPPTLPCPSRTTPIASFPWRCGWSWRTACPIKPPVGICGVTIASLSPSPPSRTGWRPGGKKAARQIWTHYLDWALRDFSGYIAADELYDGPFCVLSIVDNRTFKRLLYQVLNHNPDHKDITKFFQRFRMALRLRGLKLRGVTTDGSPLYPEPLQAVFGKVPHQICEFHIIKELTKAILRAVAKVRKKLAADKPAAQRGRPATLQAKRAVHKRERLQQKIGALFEHRYLFVEHDLTAAQRRTWQRITRGLPQLRTLRAIMEEVYRLFDRRCRTDTALAKLAKLRQRVRRFKQVGKILSKLRSPNLEKALTFLDDKLFPSTSNAVERGNRRHRKMQKTVYRVRTQEHIHNRIALDMFRDSQRTHRTDTLKTLHRKRAIAG
jgi:Transposase